MLTKTMVTLIGYAPRDLSHSFCFCLSTSSRVSGLGMLLSVLPKQISYMERTFDKKIIKIVPPSAKRTEPQTFIK